MSLTSFQHDLYGGAITVSLPSDLVDASNLRQVPDHQEVFLREHTLSSIIFEINEFQTSDHLVGASGATATTASNITNTDTSAAAHHLTDTVQAPDFIVAGGLNTIAVSLTRPSVAKYPSYLSSASIITPEINLRASAHQATLPVTWQSNPVQREYETRTQQLLVRMKKHGVDFCIRINVPLKEFLEEPSTSNGDEGRRTKIGIAGQGELQWAEGVMDTIVKSLDVKDFGLFGGS